jgi:hypothetical protein
MKRATAGPPLELVSFGRFVSRIKEHGRDQCVQFDRRSEEKFSP